MAIIESCNYVAEIARASPLLLAFGVVNVLLLGLLHFKRKDNRRRDVEVHGACSKFNGMKADKAAESIISTINTHEGKEWLSHPIIEQR